MVVVVVETVAVSVFRFRLPLAGLGFRVKVLLLFIIIIVGVKLGPAGGRLVRRNQESKRSSMGIWSGVDPRTVVSVGFLIPFVFMFV